MLRIERYAGPPHKDRFLAALRGERTHRVPHFEILIAAIPPRARRRR
ncbi:MAG: hypothetical protein ABSA59_03300 [Terriglobia bacterium]|jgi:hypothetical protein